MAVESIEAFCVLFLCLASCQAKSENCSEARCKLLPVGEGFASEFRIKASEKGVRMVYLNLKIGNDTYHPLELKNEFLPERWVWANSISEHMLSLPYDYKALSLGLLTYQVRSVDVPLEDQPSGCLASLNSSCQNKVVGRALLNVTHRNSGEISERDVVCVAIIEDAFRDFFSTFFEGNVKFHCCEISKEGSTEESTSIQCELDIQSGGWFKAFYGGLNILTFVMMAFYPAIFLLLPDFIFNVQEECGKEEQRERLQLQEGSQGTGPPTTRYGATGQTSVNFDSDSNTGEVSDLTPLRDHGENETIGEQFSLEGLNVIVCRDQSQPANSQRSENRRTIMQGLIYLDEPNPITCFDFFANYAKEFSKLFPFNVKLAFLCYFVFPVFVAIKLGLNYTVDRNFLEETSRKGNAMLVGLFFTTFFDIRTFYSIMIAVIPLIMILLSCPKDFLLTLEGSRKVPCIICWENTSSVGEDMLKHFEKLQEETYHAANFLIEVHWKGIEKSIKLCSHCCTQCLEKIELPCNQRTENPLLKRLKRLIIVLWVLPCNAILLTFFGIFLGGLYLGIFLGWIGLLSLIYSPIISTLSASGRKGMQLTYRAKLWLSQRSRENCCQLFLFVVIFIIVEIFLVLFMFFSVLLVLAICYAGGLSCQIIARMFGLTILGTVRNVQIVSPFVSFFIVASTNIYLCYYNLQKRYQDVKQIISQKWQTTGRQSEKGTIPESLFWHICSQKSNSKHKVLPIVPEVFRMLRNMAVILIFLFLVFCSIFLVNAHDISTLATTIAVFISGAIPGLFFKGLTKEKRFTGATRTRMIKEIGSAVNEYIMLLPISHERGNLANAQRCRSMTV